MSGLVAEIPKSTELWIWYPCQRHCPITGNMAVCTYPTISTVHGYHILVFSYPDPLYSLGSVPSSLVHEIAITHTCMYSMFLCFFNYSHLILFATLSPLIILLIKCNPLAQLPTCAFILFATLPSHSASCLLNGCDVDIQHSVPIW